MLEKIGLPAKPSVRGNNWVVDASHCQGCSSQFTFINRKHHCRRCGGLFCNSCTQQRMFLRGQGDSPVRICDPCKKLEEAARFDLRHGNRNRAGKGSSRSALKSEDEVLAQILASDTKGSSSSRSSFPNQEDSNLDRATSASSFTEESSANNPNDAVPSTPEELRQQALDEKKKYRVLKGEGKPDEAMKAFKRGRELERQADALELYLRKSRKKSALLAGITDANPNSNLTGDGSSNTRLKNRSQSRSGVEKGDLMSELKDLGWSEMDLQSEEKKSGNMSIEGELSSLIGEVSGKTNLSKGNSGIDRTEITAHKRKALVLKREGKLAEAKEELKKAKLLEKQAEEQELLGGAEDSSDDEFSDLIRSIEENKQENASSDREYNKFTGLSVGDIDNIETDLNLEVTEEDMADPDLTATLKSLGWAEEPNEDDVFASFSAVSRVNQAARAANESSSSSVQGHIRSAVRKPRRSKAEIQRELLGLKRKALTLRREGKTEEAEEVRKAEKELEDEIAELDATKNKSIIVDPPVQSPIEEVNEEDVTENDLQDPSLLVMLKDLGWKEDQQHESAKAQEHFAHPTGPVPSETTIQTSKSAAGVPRSKMMMKRELLGLKRKALELRRKGEMDEAEEVMRKADVLEAEIKELEAGSEEHQPDASEERKSKSLKSAAAKETVEDAVDFMAKPASIIPEEVMSIGNNKTSREELSASSYRTQGNALGDLVDLLTGNDDQMVPQVFDENPANTPSSSDQLPLARPSNQDSPVKSSPEKVLTTERRPEVVQEAAEQKIISPLKQEILEHKKRAVALKREGRIAEAREELKRAKLLEKNLDEEKPQSEPGVTISSSATVPTVPEEEHRPPASASKPLSGRERFKIQQKSLGHKRQALKFRKEGRIQEAEAEFELAKVLEAQLEESNPNDSGKSSEGAGDVVVEDLLDPELLSALTALGIADTAGASRSPDKPKLAPVNMNSGRTDSSSSSSKERTQLEEDIKAEKVKALNLKRSGKQAEALAALRHAKLLQNKLNALPR